MKQEGFDIKVGRRGPDKLLTTFSKSPFWIWVIMSLVIHLSISAFISYGFIRDNYIDPEGAVARKAAALAAAKPEPPAAPKPVAPKPAPPAAVAPTTVATTPTNLNDRLLEERKNTPVVKRITETAKPDEIPKQPTDLGISLDDTKLK